MNPPSRARSGITSNVLELHLEALDIDFAKFVALQFGGGDDKTTDEID